MIRQWLPSLAGLAISVTAFGAAEAGEEQAAEPQLYWIYKEIVKPSMIGQYEQASRDLVQALEDAEVDPEQVHFRSVYGPELGYAYVIPIEGFAGMDEMRTRWQGVIEKIGESKWKSVATRTDSAVERRESFNVLSRPDLSHHPEKPRVPESEVRYLSYAFYYVIPGMEEKMEDVAREFASMYREHGLSDRWTVYQSVTGSDLPMYVVIFGARSAAEFAARQEALDEKLGNAAEELGMQAMACVRRVEKKEGWLRPDLSYPRGDHDHGHERDGDGGHGHEHGDGHDQDRDH